MTFGKVITLAVLALFVACSPQKRLTRLLRQHPELVRRDTAIKVDVKLPVPYLKAVTLLTIKDQWGSHRALPAWSDSTPQNNGVPDTDTLQHPVKTDFKNNGISVTAGCARASVLPTDSGWVLMAEQLPDTIPAQVEIHDIPILLTEAEPTPEKPLHAFFRLLGIFVSVGLLLIGIVCMVLRFIK